MKHYRMMGAAPMAEKSILKSSDVLEETCSNFNPTRLTLASKRRGYCQTELAKKLVLTPRTTSLYETGKNPPSIETFEKIQSVLNFPAAFFVGDNLDEPNVLT